MKKKENDLFFEIIEEENGLRFIKYEEFIKNNIEEVKYFQ